MTTKKKLIELDLKTLEILEKQAKLNKRSLKNYLEFTLEETAMRLSEPSEEYKAMIDDMIKRLDDGTLKTIPIEEIRKKYGISRRTVD